MAEMQAVVHCPACNATVPCATPEEADKRAERHTRVTGHPTATVTTPVPA